MVGFVVCRVTSNETMCVCLMNDFIILSAAHHPLITLGCSYTRISLHQLCRQTIDVRGNNLSADKWIPARSVASTSNLFSIMLQSHYHVFLPPPVSSLAPPIPRLSFQDVVVPRNIDSQLDFGRSSQISRFKRISLSQQGQSQNSQDRKGKAKEAIIEDVDVTVEYSWTPTPLEPLGSGSNKKRAVDDSNTSIRDHIKRSRAPLNSGTVDDESVEIDRSGASGSRRRSSRVRRSTSGTSPFPHFQD